MQLLKIQSFVWLSKNASWPITNMKSQAWVILATEAAYRYGKDWLGELKEVIEDHINYVVDILGNETKIKVMKPQGTYLIWLDFSAYDLTNDRLQELLKNEAKVILNRGLDFGEEGSLHARLNVAMPKSVLEEVCQRIVTTFATSLKSSLLGEKSS